MAKLLSCVKALIRKGRREEDLSEELEFHLHREIEKNIAAGVAPEEARYAALRSFGGVDQVRERCRDVRAMRFFEEMWQDVRYGLRMLRRNPGFTTVVILTLALGIGMNTAVFSVLNSVLLRSLAYPDADRLLWLANYDDYFKQDTWGSRADYLLWRDQAHSFAGMAAYGNQDLALVAADQASQERIASVTGDFWSIAGARPTFGRLFRQGEPDTIVLSYRLFERRFGDSQVIGKSVTLNGHSFTVAGVLSEDFRFLLPQQWVSGDERREIDAYIPIPDAVETPGQPVTQKRGPAPFWVSVIGKLKPNIPIEQARAEMETIFARIAREYPTPLRNRSLHFIPLKEKLVGSARTALMVLLAAVGFVLLIASVNVANLLLARASVRQREIAIRAALGAGRMRVIRQLLAESVLLALLGGMAGLLLSRWCLAIMVRLGSEAVPRLGETQTDGWVLSFTLGVSLLTGLLFGVGPAITLGRTDLHDALKVDARTSSAAAGRLRGRGWLVALQLALAIVLLTGAGLMLKSFWRMNAKPPGFAPESILVMRVSLSAPQYRSWPSQEAYLHELLRRVNTAPGVLAVGIDCGTLNTAVRVEGAQQNSSKEPPLAAVRFVSPGYLRAIGVPLIKGRWPIDGESLDVVLVNQSFTRKIATGDPVGRPISGSFLSGTTVGVVADFKYWQLDAEPRPEVYMAYEWSPVVRSVRVVVRVSGDARLAASTIRKLISDIDRAQPVYELQTLEQALSDSIAPRRFNMFLLGTFAATALLLGLIGIYGVIAYSVAQRTNEIGIRRALGAQRGDIVRMVVWQGMQMALAGIGVGLSAALGLTRLMASLLYDVKANDPLTFAAVALTLAATALLACWIPALRAALVDPTVALRCE